MTATTGSVDLCPTQVDADTVALYSMESVSMLMDELGNHDGAWEQGAPLLVEGPQGCGMGVRFDGGAYGVVDNDPDFELEAGSFDLWVRLPPPPQDTAIAVISRDADNTALLGHVTLWYPPDGRLSVRLQGEGDMPNNRLECANAAVPVGQWVHVGVNFGGSDLEFFIDAEQQAGDGTVTIFSAARSCNAGPATWGIDGNANPWVIGAGSASSVEGAASPVTSSFAAGAIDELRISRQRRPFGGT